MPYFLQSRYNLYSQKTDNYILRILTDPKIKHIPNSMIKYKIFDKMFPNKRFIICHANIVYHTYFLLKQSLFLLISFVPFVTSILNIIIKHFQIKFSILCYPLFLIHRNKNDIAYYITTIFPLIYL